MISAGARFMVLSGLAFSVMTALVKLAGEHLPSWARRGGPACTTAAPHSTSSTGR
jgi:hypothetical protein